MTTPVQHWLETNTPAQLIEGILYLQSDAAYLYRHAGEYRDRGDYFMAARVQESAAHSAHYAMAAMGKVLEVQQ